MRPDRSSIEAHLNGILYILFKPYCRYVSVSDMNILRGGLTSPLEIELEYDLFDKQKKVNIATNRVDLEEHVLEVMKKYWLDSFTEACRDALADLDKQSDLFKLFAIPAVCDILLPGMKCEIHIESHSIMLGLGVMWTDGAYRKYMHSFNKDVYMSMPNRCIERVLVSFMRELFDLAEEEYYRQTITEPLERAWNSEENQLPKDEENEDG